MIISGHVTSEACNLALTESQLLHLSAHHGYILNDEILHSKIPLSAHTVYLRVSYGSQEKQRLYYSIFC